MLKSSDVHCDMKIQFCTSEGPVVYRYWIQVLEDQNLIYAMISNKNLLYQASDTGSCEPLVLLLIQANYLSEVTAMYRYNQN